MPPLAAEVGKLQRRKLPPDYADRVYDSSRDLPTPLERKLYGKCLGRSTHNVRESCRLAAQLAKRRRGTGGGSVGPGRRSSRQSDGGVGDGGRVSRRSSSSSSGGDGSSGGSSGGFFSRLFFRTRAASSNGADPVQHAAAMDVEGEQWSPEKLAEEMEQAKGERLAGEGAGG